MIIIFLKSGENLRGNTKYKQLLKFAICDLPTTKNPNIKSKMSVKTGMNSLLVFLFGVILPTNFLNVYCPKMLKIVLIILTFVFIVIPFRTHAQVILSGTVYDSTKYYGVSGVYVRSTGGSSAFTDSVGNYHISVKETDSVYFTYHNKPTIKFAVQSIANYNEFDISLRVRVNEKYKPLKEIVIFSDYRHDSAENRTSYSKIFDYERPGLKTTSSPGTPPGLDINELINFFHFRKNKQQLAFQRRLIQEEQDRYVNYRFNNLFVKKITGLSGDTLQQYKTEYRPTYAFTVLSNDVDFYEYIFRTAQAFKKEKGIGD